MKVGDRVKVISDCLSKGVTGVIDSYDCWGQNPYVVYDKGHGMLVKGATYSHKSLEVIGTSDSTEGGQEIAVFIDEAFPNDGIAEGDAVVVRGDNLDDCIEKYNKSNDELGIETSHSYVLYKGKSYPLTIRVRVELDYE